MVSKEGKDAKKARKGKETEVEVSTRFADGDLDMNMAVSEEEMRDFNEKEGEVVTDDDEDEDDGETENEEGEDRDTVVDLEITFRDYRKMCCNNNANVYNDQVFTGESDRKPCPGTSKGVSVTEHSHAAENKQDDEEEKFMERFVLFMEKRGFIKKDERQLTQAVLEPMRSKQPTHRRLNLEGNGNKGIHKEVVDDSVSEATIYKPAIEVSEGSDKGQMGNFNQVVSSDEFNNTSDESTNAEGITNNLILLDVSAAGGMQNDKHVEGARNSQVIDLMRLKPAHVPTPKEHATEMIRNAEKARERLLQVPGKPPLHLQNMGDVDEGNLLHSVIVDEEYSAIASHVEESLRYRIMTGEYIDFVRLLPKDKIIAEEEQRMEMVNRGGLSYWVPINDRGNMSISNIARWEKAFRVYSRIYTEGNPSRAIELIQYNHIIHKVALEYPWENVYAYDRKFRIHMSKYPTRN